MISLTSPITGASQTGFTTPGFVINADFAPDLYSKQWVVTSLTGTQPGATAQSGADNPFTVTFSRQKVLKGAPTINPTTGLPTGQPGRNVLKMLVRKGMRVSTNSPRYPAYFRDEYSIPAGAETVDAAEIRSALSFKIGVLTSINAALGDTLVTGYF